MTVLEGAVRRRRAEEWRMTLALRLSPRSTRSASSVEDDDNPPADTYSHLRLPGSGYAELFVR
jgi:hypothetical protein